jgi:hypothetical protein
MSCICVLAVSVPSQDSQMSCICVLGVSVPSQDSEMLCNYVLGVSSQDSEMSCIRVLGVTNQDSEMSCIFVPKEQSRDTCHIGHTRQVNQRRNTEIPVPLYTQGLLLWFTSVLCAQYDRYLWIAPLVYLYLVCPM